MINIILIVGLTGSGKSTLANMINLDNNNNYKIVDDPKDFNKDIVPYLNQDLIITDPFLCSERNRLFAKNKIMEHNPDVIIDWIFFENDPEACLVNAAKSNKKVEGFIKNQTKTYNIPPGSNVVEVYRE